MMSEQPNSMPLTRRDVFTLAGGLAASVRLSAAVVDFWNRKPPAEWTTEEIDRLLTKSPWAKEVIAQIAAAPGESRIPGMLGNIGMGGRGRGGSDRGRGGASGYQGTVRWESAEPVLAALKAPMPAGFEDRYVISVNGFPRSRQEELENLKALSSLQAKGRELVQAGVVQQQVASGSSFLFGFSRELLPLTADDKEVLFSTQLGNLVVKARFVPKEMLYHGQLAV
jgi:hypothetical protein